MEPCMIDMAGALCLGDMGIESILLRYQPMS